MPITVIGSIPNYPSSNPAILAEVAAVNGTSVLNGAGAGTAVTMAARNRASFTFNDVITPGLYEVRYLLSGAQIMSGIVWLETTSGTFQLDDPARLAVYNQRLLRGIDTIEIQTDDSKAIEFDWDIPGATFAQAATNCEVFFPGVQAGQALAGPITQVRPGRYALAYRLADRAANGTLIVPGTLIYKLKDDAGNTDTRAVRIVLGAAIFPGSYAVSVTVATSTAVVGGAVVQVLKNGLHVAWGITNTAGQVTFYLDAATYTLQIKSTPSYLPLAPSAAVVAGPSSFALTLVPQTAAPPDNPDVVTGTLITYDQNGAIEAGVIITIRAIQPMKGGTGSAYDSQSRTVLSDNNGLVSIPGLHPGVSYRIKRGTGPDYTYQVPITAFGVVEIPDILGQA